MTNKDHSPDSLFTATPKKSMAEQVYAQLREMIDSGKLEAGYTFPNENEMCQQMHIGRSTLREAYEKLSLAGYITRTRRGTRVNDRRAVLNAMSLTTAVEESNAQDFREFRYMLECRDAALAAQHETEDDIAELVSVQGELVQAKERLDIDAMMRLDKAFHVGIATATHNELLIVSMLAVSSVWDVQVLRNFKHAVEKDRTVLETMTADHDAILQALRAHDAIAAETAMRNHISHVSL